jgi:hypothetical protein
MTLIALIASVCLAQEATPAPSPAAKPKPVMSKAQIQRNLIASEKKLWEAWKNKNDKPFRAALSSDTVMISEMGVSGKEAIVKEIGSGNCEVGSYDLSDFKLTWINSDTALLTYKATQDVTCNGTKGPAAVWASSVWVRRGGKWYAATHQETPAQS